MKFILVALAIATSMAVMQQGIVNRRLLASYGGTPSTSVGSPSTTTRTDTTGYGNGSGYSTPRPSRATPTGLSSSTTTGGLSSRSPIVG